MVYSRIYFVSSGVRNREALVKSCMLKVVKLIFGKASEKKMLQVFLSNYIIKRRISYISPDVTESMLHNVKAFSLSFQVDEANDINSCAQLMVFVR